VLAQKGVQVIMHNTLAASDYALIDQDTLSPRPNYWAAVLWAKVMGTTVLAAPKSPAPELRLFAHCLKGQKGGVGLLALNTGSAARALKVGDKATAWVMTGAPIDTRAIKINGGEPSLDDKGALSVPGQSIAFVAVRDANNKACS
jgi:heparanase